MLSIEFPIIEEKIYYPLTKDIVLINEKTQHKDFYFKEPIQLNLK